MAEKRADLAPKALENLLFETPEDGFLFEALGQLEPEQRALLHLRFYEGFTVRELARQFGISSPALSARLYRAKQQLRSKLEELGYGTAL